MKWRKTVKKEAEAEKDEKDEKGTHKEEGGSNVTNCHFSVQDFPGLNSSLKYE